MKRTALGWSAATMYGLTTASLADYMIGLPTIAADQKTVAERKWQAPTKAPKPQKACDIGLFSDDASQLDLVEMLQEPTNE